MGLCSSRLPVPAGLFFWTRGYSPEERSNPINIEGDCDGSFCFGRCDSLVCCCLVVVCYRSFVWNGKASFELFRSFLGCHIFCLFGFAPKLALVGSGMLANNNY